MLVQRLKKDVAYRFSYSEKKNKRNCVIKMSKKLLQLHRFKREKKNKINSQMKEET